MCARKTHMLVVADANVASHIMTSRVWCHLFTTDSATATVLTPATRRRPWKCVPAAAMEQATAGRQLLKLVPCMTTIRRRCPATTGCCTNSEPGHHACTCAGTCNTTPVCEASCDCDRCLFDTSGSFTRRFEGTVEAMLARTDTEFTGADHQTLVRTRLTKWFARKPGLAVTGDYLTDTNNLDSYGVGLRSNCARSTRGWNDILLGYRYIRREDPGDPMVPDSRTTTEFNGGELGFVYQNRRRLLSCELLAKTALGANTYQDGSSRFAVVPEVGAQLGLQLTRRLAMTSGYTLIYWSDSASEVNSISMEREFGYGMLQSLNLGLKASW